MNTASHKAMECTQGWHFFFTLQRSENFQLITSL